MKYRYVSSPGNAPSNPRFAGIAPILLALLVLALSGCAPTGGQSAGDLSTRQIVVVTTTGLVADIATRVGGERVAVSSLMGAGVDPHLFKPSAGDVQKLDRADVILYNGLELEGKMEDILSRMAKARPTIAVADDIPLSELRKPPEFAGAYDPHIWFDASLWAKAVQRVERALSELDPKSADLYRKNGAAYRAELAELHTTVRDEIAKIPKERRVLITAHDAFGYFGRAYDIEVRGLQGISTATEAGAGDIQQLVDFIASRGIKAIFVESSVPKRTIEAVEAAVKARGRSISIGGELYSDSLGAAGTPEGTYTGMLKTNVRTIVEALR